MEERRKQDRRQDCQTCEEHSFRIMEFKNEIGNLVRKITAICERLEKLENTAVEKWKEHLKFADDSLKDQRIWKRSIEQEHSDLRLLIQTIKSSLEVEMKRIELDQTKEVDALKVEFISTTKEIEKGQTKAVNKVLFVVIAGLILNVLVNKFIV